MTTEDSRRDDGRVALERGAVLGTVVAVHADRVDVAMSGRDATGRLTVSDLVAMPASDGFLIGLVLGVARRGSAKSSEPAHAEVMPVGTFHAAAGRSGSFRLGASQFPHIDAACHLIDGEQLADFMAVVGDDVAADERLVLGRYVSDQNTAAVADANRLLQRHVAILGNSGAGKSWTVALLLERAARLRHANVIVLDLHGEYAPLTEADGGNEPVARGLRIAGPGDLLFAGDDVLHLPYWLLEREELLSLVLNEDDRFASDQRMCLNDHVQTLKRAALVEMGMSDAVATATADSPVPFRLEHLLEWLARDEVETIIRQPSGRVDAGPYAGKLGGLISRFEARTADPRYSFIFHPPERAGQEDWLMDTAEALLSSGEGEQGIKIVDLSEVPTSILPMVAGVLARLVYNLQFWMPSQTRTPICIVCDEAHLYLPAGDRVTPVQRTALDAFEMIAKEGRKYGVCLAVVSQRPSDVSHTVLSQCNNYVVLRLTNDQDQAVVSRLVSGALAGVSSMLPMLDVGEALVIGDAMLLPVRVKIDAPTVTPDSATLPYWSLWATKSSDPQGIAAGVEALRNQWRGAEVT